MAKTTALLILSLYVMAILNGNFVAANRGFPGKDDHDGHDPNPLYDTQHFGLWGLIPFALLHPWLFHLFGPWWWLRNEKIAGATNMGNIPNFDEGHANAPTVP
ncbi:hypothetical protein SESBI_42930 [Sesbania bispinosa]|nr:hypothetical protein SESBI_42930 [Sesbania bispinosa]